MTIFTKDSESDPSTEDRVTMPGISDEEALYQRWLASILPPRLLWLGELGGHVLGASVARHLRAMLSAGDKIAGWEMHKLSALIAAFGLPAIRTLCALVTPEELRRARDLGGKELGPIMLYLLLRFSVHSSMPSASDAAERSAPPKSTPASPVINQRVGGFSKKS